MPIVSPEQTPKKKRRIVADPIERPERPKRFNNCYELENIFLAIAADTVAFLVQSIEAYMEEENLPGDIHNLDQFEVTKEALRDAFGVIISIPSRDDPYTRTFDGYNLLGKKLDLSGKYDYSVLTSVSGFVFVKNAGSCAEWLHERELLTTTGCCANQKVHQNQFVDMTPIEICATMGHQSLGCWLWHRTTRLKMSKNPTVVYPNTITDNALVHCIYNVKFPSKAQVKETGEDPIAMFRCILNSGSGLTSWLCHRPEKFDAKESYCSRIDMKIVLTALHHVVRSPYCGKYRVELILALSKVPLDFNTNAAALTQLEDDDVDDDISAETQIYSENGRDISVDISPITGSTAIVHLIQKDYNDIRPILTLLGFDTSMGRFSTKPWHEVLPPRLPRRLFSQTTNLYLSEPECQYDQYKGELPKDVYELEYSSVDVEHLDGKTCLHYAVGRRHFSLEVVKLLLKLQPKLAYIADHKGNTPMHSAVKCGNHQVLDYLVTAYPEMATAKNLTRGFTSLHLAVLENDLAAVALLSHKASGIYDNNGNSSLDYLRVDLYSPRENVYLGESFPTLEAITKLLLQGEEDVWGSCGGSRRKAVSNSRLDRLRVGLVEHVAAKFDIGPGWLLG